MLKSKDLRDFRLGTVASSDHETPLTDDKSAVALLKKGNWQEKESVTDRCHDRPGKPGKSFQKLGQEFI